MPLSPLLSFRDLHQSCLTLALSADVIEASVNCLAIADEATLPHLKAVALDFIMTHHAAVMACPAYASLSTSQLHLIASEACAQHSHMNNLLHKLAVQSRTAVKPPAYH